MWNQSQPARFVFAVLSGLLFTFASLLVTFKMRQQGAPICSFLSIAFFGLNFLVQLFYCLHHSIGYKASGQYIILNIILILCLQSGSFIPALAIIGLIDPRIVAKESEKEDENTSHKDHILEAFVWLKHCELFLFFGPQLFLQAYYLTFEHCHNGRIDTTALTSVILGAITFSVAYSLLTLEKETSSYSYSYATGNDEEVPFMLWLSLSCRMCAELVIRIFLCSFFIAQFYYVAGTLVLVSILDHFVVVFLLNEDHWEVPPGWLGFIYFTQSTYSALLISRISLPKKYEQQSNAWLIDMGFENRFTALRTIEYCTCTALILFIDPIRQLPTTRVSFWWALSFVLPCLVILGGGSILHYTNMNYQRMP